MAAVNKVHLLVIDPQNDFCDPNGSLYVPGADQDMNRTATMVNRLGSKIGGIHITLDSHQMFDVAHPIFWSNSAGDNPKPFTIISSTDIVNGVWVPTLPHLLGRMLAYTKTLESVGKVCCIWPPHCLIGSWGHNVFPSVYNAINDWVVSNIKMVNYVVKGTNPFTEHYSAIAADVIDPTDPATYINKDFVRQLENQCDIIAIVGEARNFCVKSTVMDIIKNFTDPKAAQKIVLITDGMSDVPGFDNYSQDFITGATAAGVRFDTTTNFLQ